MAEASLSSLPLQIFIYFHRWFACLFLLVNIILFVYKGAVLPYPPNNFGWEITFIFFYAILQSIRLFLGSKGNKTEQTSSIGWFLGLTVPVILIHVFYLQAQIYVLRADIIINVMAIVWLAIETLLGLIAFCIFRNQEKLI
eukprot:GILI01033856.1.p1 GENE.GILI01033856.1~~GILI01033856.1.p1  ORF type:complete len:141 (+),score=22.97 GILI01033856.1:126-548(+)